MLGEDDEPNGGGDHLWARRGCDDDLGASQPLKFGRRIGRGAVNVMAGTQLPRQWLFVCTSRDGDRAKAHLGSKLNGQMPEPADAQDSYGVPSAHATVAQRVEGGDASAHQRGGIDGIDRLRNERQSLERNQYVLLISAIHRDARDSLVRTRDEDSATA